MKGKRVIAKAIVKGAYGSDFQWSLFSGEKYNDRYRSIFRKEEIVTGICLGKSFLCEGQVSPWSSYDAVEFIGSKRHAVYVIEPDGREKDRYYKPIKALIKDVREE